MPSVSATVTTPDGTCPVTLHTPRAPARGRAWSCTSTPAASAPPCEDMAAKLAGYGYAVLLPDVYYRHGDWEPFDMRTVFGDPEQRKPADDDGRHR